MTGADHAQTPGLAPVARANRILNLDVLRGAAVLGILAVNAMSFAWPIATSADPASAPFAMEGADRIGAWVVDVFFQDKFRSLFSMLFGVSIFLVGGEAADHGRGRLVRRRLWWLGLFGLIHGLAVWYGDILLHYACCGLLLLSMRSWPAGRLIRVGGGVSLAIGLVSAGMALAVAHLPSEVASEMAESAPNAGSKAIGAIIETVRSGWGPAMYENLKAWMLVQGISLLLIPATMALMMLGLGLFKSGWLSGKAPVWTYVTAVMVASINLAVLGICEWRASGIGTASTEGMVGMAGAFGFVITLGYAAVLILLARFGGRAVSGVLAPAGRMAFTNYLSQSLIMASLFYLPWGPRLYGQIGPGALWAVVVAVWLAQLVWSPLWLSRFEMGPLEWVWRRVTYGRKIELLKRA